MPSLVEDLERAGLRGGLVERVSYAALASTDPLAMVASFRDGLMVLEFPASGAKAVLVVQPGETAFSVLGSRVNQLLVRGLEVCVVSDDPADEKRLKKAMPTFVKGSVPTYRVSSDGKVHHVAQVPLVKTPFHRMLEALPAAGTTPDWQALAATRAAAETAWNASVQEASRFASDMAARPVRVTRVLAGLIGAMFLLEMWLGTGAPVWALRRLGALDAERLTDGEWWLAVSATFLHGGWLHLLFNGIVLWTLGRSLERILGAPKFIILYGLSGLAGSLISAYRLEPGGLSVGASGALWGLLAAEALLVSLANSPLPPVMRAAARQSVVTNLVLNVMNSFRAHVDWAAHLGGGVAGALVTLLLLRIKGERAPSWLRGTASVLAAFYVVGLGTALVRADLPAMAAPDERITVSIPELQVDSVELPALIASTRKDSPPGKDGTSEVVFGEVRRDPVAVGLLTSAHGDDAAIEAQAQAVLEAIKEGNEGSWVRGPAARAAGTTWWVTGRMKFDQGALVDTVFIVEKGRWTRVEVILWPDAEAQWSGLADTVAGSVKWKAATQP
ncbi:MAG: rhomboid family intramembrane serine protease [Deltaproteobacteria bacterium]|nr:rhomboid family intramembrane serine protease [Deltaproteobacteria bacterium]